MKDKSIKSTMKSWIMLSDKELDDTQVYMKEQEDMKGVSDDTRDVSEEINIASQEAKLYSDTDLHADTGVDFGKNISSDAGKAEAGKEREPGERVRRSRLTRDEEIEQLMQEVGQEVVDDNEEEAVPRRRRQRHKDKKSGKQRGGRSWNLDEKKPNDDTIIRNSEEVDYTKEMKEEELKHMEPELKKVDFSEVTTEKSEKPEKSQKSGGMGKVFAAGIGVVLVLIIAGLGYQNQSLQKQNLKLKAQVASFEKEKKDAEKASEEQALQTKNEDGVVVNTDKMFQSVKVGDKEYKLLAKVSDFTKDGWKLEALRNENATLVPGGKLEKDAYLTSTDGKKIGVIIRNMSDKNQKVSDCIVTKLSFSKEMFDGQITLPEELTFSSTEKDLKKAGFKKDADGVYCYTSKKIKDDTIKMAMADGGSVSEITLERAVEESSATATTAGSTEATTSEDSTNTSDTNTSEGVDFTQDTTTVTTQETENSVTEE